MNRKGIRDAAAAALTAAMVGTSVYPFKRQAHDRATPFVCAYFNTGTVEEGPDMIADEGELHVVVMAPDADSVDDTLDALGDTAVVTFLSDRKLGGACRNLIHTGWAYDRQNFSGWVALILAFRVSF